MPCRTVPPAFASSVKPTAIFRFVSIQKVPEYPLIVDISVTESNRLPRGAPAQARSVLAARLFLLFSIYLLHAISRQVRLLSNSEASLAQKSRELEQMARCDALTGLANRTLFMEETSAALGRMQRAGERFSILMLDLDRFKTVNDSLGIRRATRC